jgi:hypothetical protein
VGNRIPFGVTFLGTLVLSWMFVTATIGLAIWSDRDASATRLATWASLWLFSVVVPTLNALAVHQSLHYLRAGSETDATAFGRLSSLRSVLLLSANMALLSAFALILGR